MAKPPGPLEGIGQESFQNRTLADGVGDATDPVDLAGDHISALEEAGGIHSHPHSDVYKRQIVDRSGDDVLQMDAYDLVSAALAEEAGEVYDYDRAHIAAHEMCIRDRLHLQLLHPAGGLRVPLAE